MINYSAKFSRFCARLTTLTVENYFRASVAEKEIKF
jgi:hypothetical protein